MKITVDFDGTLTRPDVQEFVKKAISNGHQVFVVTLRHNEKISNHLFGDNKNGWNSDIIELATRLGCSKIYLTNGVEKYKYIQPIGADLHLDDVNAEVTEINSNTNTLALWVNKPDWLTTANKLIK